MVDAKGSPSSTINCNGVGIRTADRYAALTSVRYTWMSKTGSKLASRVSKTGSTADGYAALTSVRYIWVSKTGLAWVSKTGLAYWLKCGDIADGHTGSALWNWRGLELAGQQTRSPSVNGCSVRSGASHQASRSFRAGRRARATSNQRPWTSPRCVAVNDSAPRALQRRSWPCTGVRQSPD